MANHEFVAYIDESGDDGLAKYRTPGGAGGASHWLILGCCIVRRTNDAGLVAQRDAILKQINQTKRRDIHFAELKHAQKSIVAESLGKLPVKLTNILSCKQHIPDPTIYKQRRGQLYWYLCRTLIERISWCCASHSKTDQPLVRLVFSTRGGMKYQDFRDYVGRLQGMETRIDWRAISNDEDYIRAEAHNKLAGLQFADVSARAFAEAVEPNVYGRYENSYAKALKPALYEQNGNYTSYGVKMLGRYELLDDRQKELFQHYGKK